MFYVILYSCLLKQSTFHNCNDSNFMERMTTQYFGSSIHTISCLYRSPLFSRPLLLHLKFHNIRFHCNDSSLSIICNHSGSKIHGHMAHIFITIHKIRTSTLVSISISSVQTYYKYDAPWSSTPQTSCSEPLFLYRTPTNFRAVA